MSATWGKKIRYTIFGESHGKGIGITIDGLPPGFSLDLVEITREMARRAPGQSQLATARNEKDAFTIYSGFINGKTTGTPLCAIIENSDQRSKDYETMAQKFRPPLSRPSRHLGRMMIFLILSGFIAFILHRQILVANF